MFFKHLQGFVRALLITTLVVLYGAGCTKYATTQDLETLESQKQAAISVERKRDGLRRAKAQLESWKAQNEAELAAAQEEQAKVKARFEERGLTEETAKDEDSTNAEAGK